MAAHKFAMSRSARITLLLIIDVVFFFVELIVGRSLTYTFASFCHSSLSGYAVGSLALVADSFHMLKCDRNYLFGLLPSDNWRIAM